MGDVVTFPDSDIVNELKALLAEAQKGEVLAIAFARKEKGGEYTFNAVGDIEPLAMCGALHMLQDSLLHGGEEEDPDTE